MHPAQCTISYSSRCSRATRCGTSPDARTNGTGRHQGAESLEESRVLLALDFAGDVVYVVSQPLKISFGICVKRRSHTPDHLAVTRCGV
ncbi:hypothetical protein OV320_1657 [Actinobacteria bacterium OV320]|nr:hypothetical protein OV320_1657 [Actinobacteria bacterium OV320]